MLRSVGLALASVSAFLLAGAAFASEETPAEPASSQPATQGETQTPATAPAPPAPGTQSTTERDPMDEIVCKKEEATVGSRLGARKVCKTRRKWRDEQRDATSPDLPDGGLQPGPGAGN